ncbi:hypothetical protein PoB_004949100 [Plakobranchus ocellatus]|uniref:Uncharacterized protein n=1 Tax=Plakobranchus ocellatus TaxID=259542 RepID=A0AAV4BR86_9GAST|nr:hypothetical protein PoB_004949100 [Plakobranchus ocellatus]
MADQNLREDFVNVGDNDGGEVIDSEESDVTLVNQEESDTDSDTSGKEETNIEEYNPASDVWTLKEGTECICTPLPTKKNSQGSSKHSKENDPFY